MVTKITLKKATNAGGIGYSQCVFSCERTLDPAEQAAIAPVIEQAKTYASGLTVAQMQQYDDLPIADPATGEVIEALN